MILDSLAQNKDPTRKETLANYYSLTRIRKHVGNSIEGTIFRPDSCFDERASSLRRQVPSISLSADHPIPCQT